MSRAHQDFIAFEGSVVPLRWMRLEPQEKSAGPALRWLLHVNALFLDKLQERQTRLAHDVDEARQVRSGTGTYAQNDMQALHELVNTVALGLVRLRTAQALVRSAGLPGLRPLDRAPSPYSREPAWQRLKQLAERLRNPHHDLGTTLTRLLSAPVAMADAPFLFQRWCGMHLLRGLQRLGWERSGSMVGALYLGGRVDFRHGPCSMTVWIEPRISFATMALTGWRSSRGEVTPDFLITHGQGAERQGYVLDATLSTEESFLKGKCAKYMNAMTGVDLLWIAGVPVPRRLRRSWTIAPLKRATCSLFDPEGQQGVIPLHPQDRSLAPLDAWLADISRQARMSSLLMLEDEKSTAP